MQSANFYVIAISLIGCFDPMISHLLVTRSNYAQGYISNIKEIANESPGNENV